MRELSVPPGTLGDMTHPVVIPPLATSHVALEASPSLDVPGLIRRVRRDADLSQRELAAAVSVDQSTVARWERGHSVPDVLLFARVLAVADLVLSVVDAAGQPPTPMTDAAPVDGQFRRFPAHLDLVEEPHPLTYEPRFTSPRRPRRDARRARLGRPADHPTLEDFLAERRRRREVRVTQARERALDRAHARAHREGWSSPGDWGGPPCSCPVACEEQPSCLPSCACSCEPTVGGWAGG